MNLFWMAFRAEFAKQHQDSFGGKSVFFSLLFWPVLTFLATYYAMKPYRMGTGSALSRVIPHSNIVLFLITGFLVFELFWTVVQSAWTFSRERQMGTLEMVFLTPSPKMAFLLGRSVYGLVSGIWMFAIFSILTLTFFVHAKEIQWLPLLTAVFITIISAAVWGALLSSVSLFSRDSGYVYYIFQEPMNLFGGVQIPPMVFPLWAKLLSLLFPVTYSLYLIRNALNGQTEPWWWLAVLALVILNGCLLLVTKYLLIRADRHARQQGSWVLF